MSSTQIISEFEAKLEAQIKECFAKELYEDDDGFYVAADYDTKCRINDLVKQIGLQVYGMSVDEAEFVVRFEFVGEYSEIQNAPTHCRISWSNDGEYDFFLRKDNLQDEWWVSVKDEYFNHKTTDAEIIKEVIGEMSAAQLMKQLKAL